MNDLFIFFLGLMGVVAFALIVIHWIDYKRTQRMAELLERLIKDEAFKDEWCDQAVREYLESKK